MSYEFRPAVRDKTSVILALAGASGSGKTFTAILMALGLAYPGMSPGEILETLEREGKSRIFVIDSEGGRGLHYAAGPGEQPDFKNTFPYQYGEIRAPYTPENYRDAALAAEEAGAWVIIIDSASHEYESEGGIMEIADQIESGVLKPGKTLRDTEGPNGWQAWEVKPVKSPGNWKEPKTRHKKMVNRLIQCRAHLIFCLRAEEKMLMERKPKLDARGEQKIWNGKPQFETIITPAEDRPLVDRWQPICEKRFMYEMTASFLLTPGAPGVGHPIKNLQAQFVPIFPEGQQLGVENGRRLAEWAMGRNAGTRPEGHSGPSLSDPPGQDLRDPPQKKTMTPEQWKTGYLERVRATQSPDELLALQQEDATVKALARLRENNPDIHKEITEAHMEQYADLMADDAADEETSDAGTD